MSDRSTTFTSAQVQIVRYPTAQVEINLLAEHATVAARLLPWWNTATPQQQQMVLEDLGMAYDAEQLPPEEYCADPMPLAEHMAAVLELRGQLGLPELQAPAPEAAVQTPEPAPAKAPEAVVQEQAAAAAEQAAEQEAKAREEAASTLKATVKAYRQGEKAYRAGLLAAGRLGDLYLHQRMVVGDKRAGAVQALEGELAKYASSTVDANRLIACYHAYRLLAEEPGVKEDVSYGHYRDVWAQLVQRVDKDTPQEHWVLLPGFEEPARELFAKAVQDSLKKDSVLDRVKMLQRQYLAAECEKARLAKLVADEKSAAEKAAATKARQEALTAQAAAEQADAKAQAATEEEKAELTTAAEKAREELLAKQRAAVEAQAKADAEARAAAKKDADARAKADTEAKAIAKAEKAADRAAEKAAAKDKPARGTVGSHLLATAKAGTAKDVAEMAAELITGAETPDDVLEQLLHLLHSSKELSGKAKRAVDAALLVLTRTDRPTAAKPSTSPVAVAAALGAPSTNGAVAVA